MAVGWDEEGEEQSERRKEGNEREGKTKEKEKREGKVSYVHWMVRGEVIVKNRRR